MSMLAVLSILFSLSGTPTITATQTCERYTVVVVVPVRGVFDVLVNGVEVGSGNAPGHATFTGRAVSGSAELDVTDMAGQRTTYSVPLDYVADCFTPPPTSTETNRLPVVVGTAAVFAALCGLLILFLTLAVWPDDRQW
jgi:hypothetical protein